MFTPEAHLQSIQIMLALHIDLTDIFLNFRWCDRYVIRHTFGAKALVVRSLYIFDQTFRSWDFTGQPMGYDPHGIESSLETKDQSWQLWIDFDFQTIDPFSYISIQINYH